MRVYLDNCCFNRPYDDQTQLSISLETQAKLYIQDMIKNKKIELVVSYMLVFENHQNPYEIKKKAIREFIHDNTSVYINYEKAEDVKKIAESIISAGIKTKDAVHLASAIAAECDYFLTTDKRLLKYKTDKLILTDPVDFVGRLEAENYERND